MGKKLVKLIFPEALIQDPVIYRLGHEFRIITSIFRASVGEKEAWLVLQLEGEEEEILRSLEFLKSLGIRVEQASESDMGQEG
jgi:ABC-type methionine transport system ATPase subunit